MHTLKTKRELEIFEQGVKKGKEEMKEMVLELVDRHGNYLDFIISLNNL